MTISYFDPNITLGGNSVEGINEFPSLTAVDFSTDSARGFDSHFYLTDSFSTTDMTQGLEDAIKFVGDTEGSGANKLNGSSCWGSTFESSETKGYRYKGFHLVGPRWTYITRIGTSNHYVFNINATLTMECENATGERQVNPGLSLLFMVIVKNDHGRARFEYLNEPQIQNQMAMISDDDDFIFTNVLQQVFAMIFANTHA
jgi:hypothetical protein